MHELYIPKRFLHIKSHIAETVCDPANEKCRHMTDLALFSNRLAITCWVTTTSAFSAQVNSITPLFEVALSQKRTLQFGESLWR